MTSPSHEDNIRLEAAEGWLGLGDWQEASLELAQIDPELETLPRVIELRYKICGAAHRWEEAAELARAIGRRLPEHPWCHFHLAFALHELKRTTEAYQTLRAVVDQFPADWLMRFNLACYACQLGNLEEAMAWLAKAVTLADRDSIRDMALQDQDLQPLWAKIREL